MLLALTQTPPHNHTPFVWLTKALTALQHLSSVVNHWGTMVQNVHHLICPSFYFSFILCTDKCSHFYLLPTTVFVHQKQLFYRIMSLGAYSRQPRSVRLNSNLFIQFIRDPGMKRWSWNHSKKKNWCGANQV